MEAHPVNDQTFSPVCSVNLELVLPWRSVYLVLDSLIIDGALNWLGSSAEWIDLNLIWMRRRCTRMSGMNLRWHDASRKALTS